MEYLKNYKDFEINEKLSSERKRELMLLPQGIIGFFGKKLGIFPLLGLRWRELKRKTRGYKDSPFHSGEPTKVDNITMVDTSILKSKSLEKAMMLGGWKVYLSERKSSGGIFPKNGKVEKSVIYLTKDSIKSGDTCLMVRLNDHDAFNKEDYNKYHDDNPNDFPVIILAARFDDMEKIKRVDEYVDDICLEIEDEFPVEVFPDFSYFKDYLDINIKFKNKIIFSKNLDSLLIDVSERIKDYLNSEGYKMNYKLSYSIKGPLYYGDHGKECIDCTEMDFSSESINALLSDISKCSKTWFSKNNPFWNVVKEIELSKINIEFTK